MDNWDIAKILRHMSATKNRFLGVFPAEKIPSRRDIQRYPCCFVANTDPSWLPGTHWVAVFVGKNGLIEYFDSYGRRPMSPKMRAFCGRDYVYNPKVVQSIFSQSCGQFCIYFLAQRCAGKSIEYIIGQFDDDNTVFNEMLVSSFVNSRFPHHKLSSGRKRNLIYQVCKAGLCRRNRSI